MITQQMQTLLQLDIANDTDLVAFEANGQLGFMFGTDIAEALQRLAADTEEYFIEWFELDSNISDWSYHDVIENSTLFEVIAVPNSLSDKPPPTKVESALLKAINHRPELCENKSGSILRTNILIIVHHRKIAHSSQIVDIFKGLFRTKNTAVQTEMGLRASDQIRWKSINIKQNELISRHISDGYRRTELSTRFLALYKAHEASYLADIFKKVESEFFLSPKETLANAGKSLEAEVKQLFQTIETHGLHSHFENMWVKIDPIKKSNLFAAAIHEKIHNSDLSKTPLIETWKRSGSYVYQTRCAIVHSSTGVIYENFADADAFIEMILPEMEKSALALLHVDF